MGLFLDFLFYTVDQIIHMQCPVLITIMLWCALIDDRASIFLFFLLKMGFWLLANVLYDILNWFVKFYNKPLCNLG